MLATTSNGSRWRLPLMLLVTSTLRLSTLTGCSVHGPSESVAHGVFSNAGTGAAALPTISGDAGPLNTLNNPSSGVIPISMSTPAMTGAGGSAAPIVNMSTHDPIAIDACGATNPAGISAADAQKLRAGSGSAGTLKWLYPYDGTVFPRGMLAPLLMWSGPAVPTVYVHIHSMAFDYVGCLKPTAQGQLQIAQDVWDKAGQRTFGKGDVYSLELSTLSAGTVTGPITSHFEIAQATIKGSIYYNSYSSKIGGAGAVGGLVLRIPAGSKAELFGSTNCNGCHSVSADGSRLLSQFVPGMGESYQLATNGVAPTPMAAGPRGGFGAFYPDGSTYLATSAVIDVARTLMTQGQGAPTDATLYDSATGKIVANKGIPGGTLMPMFSPDGTWLVFNDYAIDKAHGLAAMHYDVRTHTATDYKMLLKEPSGDMRPGWPFILPDNGGAVFVRTDGADFSGNGAGVMSAAAGGFFGGGAAQPVAPFSELSIVDLASGTSTVLAKAMGYATAAAAASGTTYLPFGAEELQHSYFPTVSPVAAGGYFWVFFDSIRHYGVLGSQRQLWGAALDIQADGAYKLDPSHPAFYLPGQELGTGNHRAFAALDPCKKDGDKCTSGIDCCGGFCYIDAPEEFVDPVGSCTPKMNMCAKRDERCASDSDCCPPKPGEIANTCIAGFCAFVPVLN
jgi:hypothetical protein